MGDGALSRRDQINTLERAVSTDINRLQSFRVTDEAQALRYLFDHRAPDDSAGGLGSVGEVLTAPLRASVLGGLLLRPGLGTLDCTVDEGVLCAVNPFSGDTTDDTPYKFVNDGGVPGTGVLVLEANASGLVRIDVVECSIVAGNADETDSRDIFNPLTGTFDAVSQDKVVRDVLTYRIRQGVPGAGYPAAVLGWLPLAVVNVPDGTLSWDECRVWDVRPLVSERVRHPHDVTLTAPATLKQNAYIYRVGDNVTGHLVLTGFVEAEGPDGYLLGGSLTEREGPLEFTNSGFTEPLWPNPGWSLITNHAWFVYALAPFGLPRWAEYAPASSFNRVPKSPRGLFVFTQSNPPDAFGRPLTAISIPTVYGLGGSTSNARALLTGVVTSIIRRVAYGHDGMTSFGLSPLPVTLDSYAAPDLLSVALQATLIAGVHFPSHATSVLLRLSVEWVAIPTTTSFITRTIVIFDANAQEGWRSIVRARDFDNYQEISEVLIPIPQSFVASQPYVITVTYDIDTTDLVITSILTPSASLEVAGWKVF